MLVHRSIGGCPDPMRVEEAVEGRFTREGDVEFASGLFWLSRENDTWKIVALRIEDELGSFVGGTIPGSEE